jgi:hypothetical protein
MYSTDAIGRRRHLEAHEQKSTRSGLLAPRSSTRVSVALREVPNA